MRPLRTFLRAVGFLLIVTAALLDFAARALIQGRGVQARARWLHRWTARALRLLGVRLRVQGRPPSEGLLLANHLGYLDIFVLSAAAPLVFVSRADVERWPLAGPLTRMAGTIYIDRTRLTDVRRVGQALVPIVEGGQPVTLFLEGTSTGGDRVLPFRSSLLAPAIEHGWPATPAFLRYHVPGGDAAHDAAYWGDMVFLPHFVRLLGLRRIEAEVRFGTPRPAAGDRADLAARLRAEVCALGGIAG